MSEEIPRLNQSCFQGREQKRELIYSLTKKDFITKTFRAGGPGGQNQNKREAGVRIRHPVSSRTHRTQTQNRKEAFLRRIKSKEF